MVCPVIFFMSVRGIIINNFSFVYLGLLNIWQCQVFIVLHSNHIFIVFNFVNTGNASMSAMDNFSLV